MTKYTCENNNGRTIFIIPSVKKWYGEVLFLLLSGFGFFLGLSSLFFGEGDDYIRIALFLFTIYFGYSFMEGFYWLRFGKEVIAIQIEKDNFTFYRQSIRKSNIYKTKFSLVVTSLDKSYRASSEARNLLTLGISGGPLKFEIGKKYVDFGASLSKEEAAQLLKEIKSLATKIQTK